jgi:hypothetical protein
MLSKEQISAAINEQPNFFIESIEHLEYFNFGAYDEKEMHQMVGDLFHGQDAFNKGLIKTPYKDCYYRIKSIKRDLNIFSRRLDDRYIVAVFSVDGDRSHLNVIMTLKDNEKDQFLYTGESVDKTRDTAKAARLVFQMLTLLLNTKNLPMRREEPSRKLQDKRAKKNKPPLPIITYIDYRDYKRALKNIGRTHASPVPHLRRGHIRRIPPTRWHPEGKEVWIKDCLVNCRSLDEITEREEYRVRT